MKRSLRRTLRRTDQYSADWERSISMASSSSASPKRTRSPKPPTWKRKNGNSISTGSSSSRGPMRRLLRAGAAEEVVVQPQARLAALLRVELRRRERPARDGRGEAHAVLRPPDDDRIVFGVGVVAVDEVEVAAVRDAFEDRMVLHLVDAVPAHVRDLERGATAVRRWQTAHAAGHDIEAGVPAALLAHREQRLEAHAHAQERPARLDVPAQRL